ncbi:MAG: tetratricopeptide repeat-containing sulfotransferase family protein [Pseudomonadota bacterium]
MHESKARFDETRRLLENGQIKLASERIIELSKNDDLEIDELFSLMEQALAAGRVRIALKLAERAHDNGSYSNNSTLHLAKVLIYARQYGRAIEVCNELLAKYPSDTSAMVLLGHCHSGGGQFSEAEYWFLKALAIDSKCVSAISGLVKCRKFSDDAERMILQFRKAFIGGLGAAEQAAVHFAIAKIYNDSADYERAWSHAANANLQLRMRQPFTQHSLLRRHVNRLMQVYENVDFEVPACAKKRGERQHVMIVGMPRSGTTLIEQILGCHKDFYPGGEVPAIEYALAYGAPGRNSLSMLSLGERESCAEAYEEYFHEFADVSAPRITTKVLKSYLDIGFFKQIFPAGKVIFMDRDELDVSASVFFEDFATPSSYSNSIDDTMYVHAECRRLMAFWQKHCPNDVLAVSYESLVEDFENTLHKVASFLGVKREDIGDYQQSNHQVQTPSLWQVRQGIYRSSVGRWRRYSAMREYAKRLGRE